MALPCIELTKTNQCLLLFPILENEQFISMYIHVCVCFRLRTCVVYTHWCTSVCTYVFTCMHMCLCTPAVLASISEAKILMGEDSIDSYFDVLILGDSKEH